MPSNSRRWRRAPRHRRDADNTQALTTHNGPGGPRRRHLPLPEGPQVRVLPARVDSQFCDGLRLASYPMPTYPLVVYISRYVYHVRLRKKVEPSSCYHTPPYPIAIYQSRFTRDDRSYDASVRVRALVCVEPALQGDIRAPQCVPPRPSATHRVTCTNAHRWRTRALSSGSPPAAARSSTKVLLSSRQTTRLRRISRPRAALRQ